MEEESNNMANYKDIIIEKGEKKFSDLTEQIN